MISKNYEYKELTKDQKNFYKRDVGFFLNNIELGYTGYESENIVMDIEPNLTVRGLKIKGISRELTDEIALAINQSFIALFSKFEQIKKGSLNMPQLADELELTFMDYINFVLNNK